VTPEQIVQTFIRGVNAVLWGIVIIRILRRDRPVLRLERQLIGMVVLAGMWLLFIGSTGFLPMGWAKLLYTAYTAIAAVIAFAIAMGKDSDKEPDAAHRYGDPHYNGKGDH
jgi:hypothetical protein